MKPILILIILFTTPAFLQAMPLERVASPNNSITGRTHHWLGQLYVSGVVKSALPGMRAPGSYIEVDLLGSDGRILAQAQDQIGRSSSHPSLTGSNGTRYVVSFPDPLTAQAVVARVLFHNHSPGACPRKG